MAEPGRDELASRSADPASRGGPGSWCFQLLHVGGCRMP